jgi:hypothetical protein
MATVEMTVDEVIAYSEWKKIGCPMPRPQAKVRADPLTQRQQDILVWICAHVDSNGYPPTVREVCGRFGIRSTNGANDHLKALERKGWIQRPAKLVSRGLKILKRPA